MTRFHCIPTELRSFLEPLRKEFGYNHYLTFLWLVFSIMNNPKKGTLKNLSEIPAKKSYHTFLRFLKAKYLQPRRWLMFTALARLKALHRKEKMLKILADVTWVHKTGEHDWISRGYKSDAKPEQGIQKLTEWNWGYVFRLPKTWKFEQGGFVKEHLEQLPRKSFKLCWYISAHGTRKYCQYFSHRTRLNHLGDVTLIYSYIKGKLKPEKRILVTNMPLNHTEILALYQRRWCIEILFKELKSEMGLGKMQLSVTKNQMMTGIGVVLVAYNALFSIHNEPTGGVLGLKRNFYARCMHQNLLSFVSKHLPEPLLERFMLRFTS